MDKYGDRTRDEHEVEEFIRGNLDRMTLNARKFTLAESESDPMPANSREVKGYDFNNGVNYSKLIQSYAGVGFQASHLGRAINVVNKMIDTRFQPIPAGVRTEGHKEHIFANRRVTNCTIFLGYTSDMVSAGTRELIRYLVEHNMVDCIVTTAGGIEDDFMKCRTPFYHRNFRMNGADLHKRAHNRTGNLIVPNNCYREFHKFLNPILEDMREDQMLRTEWTPQKLIWHLGKEINDPASIYYWAYRKRIPVFCPAIRDGAVGDVLYFHRHVRGRTAVKLDIVEDIQALNDMAVQSVNTALITVGGGVIKHHILNANTFRDGADFSLFINTAAEFDGSDAGASPDEAKSWGKISPQRTPVKVFADATLVLPLLVAETFAKREDEFKVFNRTNLN
ncbi:probable deoxyhypusine synthase [Aplysia californica]|uniref:Probable deoxyhypusine synthase n=1 Tax=Aplysia californica TaxID=6500 RepID=A0ABM1A4F5_APLCA|nr:probable deoxyhypusine synthase [Aplysia californica]